MPNELGLTAVCLPDRQIVVLDSTKTYLPYRTGHGYRGPEGASVYVFNLEGQEERNPNVEYVGSYSFCSGCQAFIHDFEPIGREGASNSKYWMCGPCFKKLAASPAMDKEYKREPIEIEVPPMYMTAQESDYESKIRIALERWPFKTKFIAIGGIPGSGKTRATWAIAKRMALNGRSCAHQTLPVLRRTWSHERSTPWPAQVQKLEQDLMNYQWLILDDLSASAATEGWAEFLHTLIDHRTKNELPTLITSACTGEEIEATYGGALRSRLNLFTWVNLARKDHRHREEIGTAVKDNTAKVSTQ